MRNDEWDASIDELRARAQQMHEARETGLVLCRQVTQRSAKCIRHVHRREFDGAKLLLEEATEAAERARAALSPYPQLYFAGYLHDCEKELVEASAVLAIVQGASLPSADLLGVGLMAYLNGMGEASSECRRFVLDEMRQGRLDEAARILAWMETIYDDLITFDYSDAMTGGLRRTCDALRAVIERTRSDLTMTVTQHKLVDELRETRRRIAPDSPSTSD